MTDVQDIQSIDQERSEAWAFLHQQCFVHGWSADDFLTSSSNKTRRHFIIEAGRDLIGLLVLSVVGDEAEVLTICVSPDHRQQGLGETLLNHAISSLGKEGVKTVFLEVNGRNEDAISLYKKLGFLITGVRKAYYRSEDGQKDDALTMLCHLD